MTNQEPPASILAFLAEIGATHTPHHAGRSLSTHLVATWKILKHWQQPETICIAGLCHSLYGTDAFNTACLGPLDRPKVRTAIGDEAEQISFLFGAMRREVFLQQPDLSEIENRFTETKVSINHSERSAVCHILLANELDLVIAKKGSGRPDKVLKKVSPVYEKLEPFLSAITKNDYKILSQSK